MAYKLELPSSSRVHQVFHVSCLKKVIGDQFLVQTILPKLDEEGKTILEREAVTKTRTRQLRNQFHSISSSGRTYPLKIPHGRMIILYRSIESYSSVEDNTFFKKRGMLGPYIIVVLPYCCSVAPLLLLLYPFSPHIVIIVSHKTPLLLLL